MTTASDVTSLVNQELARFTDPEQLERVQDLLIVPRCEQRGWDYGAENQTYPCWIVAEHHQTQVAIGFCEFGFGPANPWGLLSIIGSGGYESMGMDCGWFQHLDECLKESFAWDHICDPANP